MSEQEGKNTHLPRDALIKNIRSNPDEVLFENEFIYIVLNRYPIVPGHCMILPKRDVATMSDLTPGEAYAFVEAIEKTADFLENEYGISCISFKHHGSYITQDHLHMHVIPTKKTYRQLFYEAKNTQIGKLTSEEMSVFHAKFSHRFEQQIL